MVRLPDRRFTHSASISGVPGSPTWLLSIVPPACHSHAVHSVPNQHSHECEGAIYGAVVARLTINKEAVAIAHELGHLDCILICKSQCREAYAIWPQLMYQLPKF